MRHSPIRCSLPKRVRSQAPFLRRRYPASPVLRACPPPHSARPVPRGFPVGVSPPPLGLPVLRRTSLYIHAVASTPAGPLGARVAVFFQRRRPSPANHRVGSRIAVFEACSAFTARYGLHTRGVALRPFTPEASEISLPTSPLRLLPTEATLVGWDFHPLKIRAFSRRTISRQLTTNSGKTANPRGGPFRSNLLPSGGEVGGLFAARNAPLTISLERQKQTSPVVP